MLKLVMFVRDYCDLNFPKIYLTMEKTILEIFLDQENDTTANSTHGEPAKLILLKRDSQ